MNEEPSCEVVVTRTGARAVRDRASGELMHPVVGPLVEAEQLYVAPSRLSLRLDEPGDALVLFDVGLGAGSNAIAAWRASERAAPSARRLELISYERDLAAFELALSDEHGTAFGFDGAAGEAARALLRSGVCETPHTRWRLVLGELPGTLDAAPGTDAARPLADIVFWDPFSPRANPDMWTLHAFATLRRRVRAGATVHTYSAATATRSALLLAGFAVGEGEATPYGKRTTVAAIAESDLRAPLDARWFDRLARSSSPLPPDAPPDARERLAALGAACPRRCPSRP